MAPSPRVLLDCTAIPANHGGVARYIHGLLHGLESSDVDLVVAAQHSDTAAIAASAPWAEIVAVPRLLRIRPLRLIWEQLFLPGLARRAGATVLHSPHYTYPIAWRRRRVVTLHDATFFSHPDVHTPFKRFFFSAWIRAAWRASDAVIVPSAATASELDRMIGLPRGHVSVARLGVDSRRFYPPTASDLAAFREANELPAEANWFAFLGTIEPRKNVSALLDAYSATRDRLGADAPRLFVAGARGWDAAALARLDAAGPESGVTMLGYVPIEQLSALLGGAIAVVYPSLGEGFGLPVVEAMACGATVITTRHLAIPEVGGDAVFYSEADASALEEAMAAVLDEAHPRADVTKRAIARASIFNWRATALAHLDAYTGQPHPIVLDPVETSPEDDTHDARLDDLDLEADSV